MFDSNEEEEIFKMLEQSGAISLYGMEGENITYRVNMEILKEVLPDLHDSITDEIDQDLLDLYEDGMIDIEYDEHLQAHFKVSDKGREYMETIIRAMEEDNE